MFTFWEISLACVLIITIYYYLKKSKPNDFEIAGVKYDKPVIPFFGISFESMLKGEHVTELMARIYNSHPNEKYSGTYEMNKPMLLLRDLDVIKQVAIKDFDHFPNHQNMINQDLDLLLGNSLFFLQDEKWKDMRSTLSPAFTSSKMRNMFVFIEHCAKQVADYFLKESEQSADNVVEIEAKDIFTRYTNDVIANSAFGLEVDSLKNRHNVFYENAKAATTFTGAISLLKSLAFFLCPRLVKMLKIPFVDKKSGDFLMNIIHSTITHRKEHSIVRKDMIHLLMEAEKGSLKHETDSRDTSEAGFATVEESNVGKSDVKKKWNNDDIYAQAFLFLTGGFETTATYIQFFFYEMVNNPDVQKKLHEEIDEYISIHGKHITYDDLPKLKYLDCCISETLRLWPPVALTDRMCVKKYNMPPVNINTTKNYQVNCGECIWIPVFAIHHDPAYFPNPKKFDPERFSDENRSSIELYAFMPFGVGPRNCIGSRFALMIAKLIVFHTLLTFEVVRTDKTEIPVQLNKRVFSYLAKDGMYLGLKPRHLKP